MMLHCKEHRIFLEITEHNGMPLRTFKLQLETVPKGQKKPQRHHHVPPMQDCALYWHADPKPGELTVSINGRVLGPCRAHEVQ